MPDPVEIIGYLAAILTSCAFVPQTLMVWRTDDTKSISLGMYSLFVVGIALWLIYGIILDSRPLIFTNLFTFSLAASILYKKIKHVRANKEL